jgi:hypothetical protein
MILGNETENRKYSALYTLNLGSTTTSAANVEELHNRMTKFTKSRFEFVNILNFKIKINQNLIKFIYSV